MAMPQVQDLQALTNQYTTALAPQAAQIDTSIAANDASGAAQQAGLDATKTSAFKGITQDANDRGGYFSGYTPDQEATYTAGTYLPAVAALQATIAGARGTLLGKKADLQTQANTSAIDAQNTQKSDLQKWQDAQDAAAAQAAQLQQTQQFTASQNALDRSASAAASSAKASNDPTPTQNMAEALTAKTGSDGKVSPGTYAALKAQWVAGGYGSASSFDTTFSGYRNTANKNYKLG